jgi:hypothetical protein
MSDDEADPELLELLRQSLGIGAPKTDEVSKDTGTLESGLLQTHVPVKKIASNISSCANHSV